MPNFNDQAQKITGTFTQMEFNFEFLDNIQDKLKLEREDMDLINQHLKIHKTWDCLFKKIK